MIARAREAWNGLQPRERSLLAGAGAVLALLAAWLWIWEPLADARQNLRAQLAEQQALLDWLERAAPEVGRLRAGDAAPRVAETGSPMAVIDRSARTAGLAGALRRIEPVGQGDLRVVMEQAAFPELMGWLAELVASRPYTVRRFSADRAGPGRVDSVILIAPGPEA
ncbi:MAG: type II secretion system protein GspM [Wenzhouxiangellaceae bacterium]